MTDPRAAYTQLIKATSRELGFEYCGIAKAQQLDDDARRLEKWLQQGKHGQMQYMENHFDLRIDPTKLVPDARSVITLSLNYFPQVVQQTDGPKISKYAYGTDYHFVIREKLNALLYIIREKIGAVTGRGFVDSAPVLERSWAQKSGMGWVGKNGNLISRQSGSFFFLATLIIDLDLVYDDPFARDFCGSCTRCITACPTQAILPNKEIDGSKCISYYTIELKDALLPDHLKGSFDNWMFGCDTCQDVCPWNRFSKPHHEAHFNAVPQVLDLKTAEWQDMTTEAFNKIFKNSPLKRSKHAGLQRNLKFLME